MLAITRLDYFLVNGAKSFLENEIYMLGHISAPEARESVRIAKERITYLATQLDDSDDINAKFKQDQKSFYELFILPYMVSKKI
ncbi:hypothetical protein HZA96_03750 [Candidatus Woesearchaeota archaeon]|nr:hypothetical protein [Candidatus Woesearchaeota archaeon]